MFNLLDKYYLNEQNEPVRCTCEEYGKNYREYESRRMKSKLKTVINGSEVSTVFLSIDHGYFDSGNPVLWETMVFGGALDGVMERYSNREDAVKGHKTMCDRVAGLN